MNVRSGLHFSAFFLMLCLQSCEETFDNPADSESPGYVDRSQKPPIISPGGGVYTEPVTVTLSAGTGASIRYTTDGSNPSASAGTVYNPAHPPILEIFTELRACAVMEGLLDSPVAIELYEVYEPIISWDFTDGLDPWTIGTDTINTSSFVWKPGGFAEGKICGYDTRIFSRKINVDMTGISFIDIRLRNWSNAKEAAIFLYGTEAVPESMVSVPVTPYSPGYELCRFNVKGNPFYTGIMEELRVDPAQLTSNQDYTGMFFSVDYIRLYKPGEP